MPDENEAQRLAQIDALNKELEAVRQQARTTESRAKKFGAAGVAFIVSAINPVAAPVSLPGAGLSFANAWRFSNAAKQAKNLLRTAAEKLEKGDLKGAETDAANAKELLPKFR